MHYTGNSLGQLSGFILLSIYITEILKSAVAFKLIGIDLNRTFFKAIYVICNKSFSFSKTKNE
jgi:hypothetical protein